MFLAKIAGVIVVKGMPPVKQKLAYIKGIARNRFNYWDARRGAIILNNYVRALEDYGWTEGQIVDDLENEIIPKTKEASNWTGWKSLIENWTAEIEKWEKPTSISARRKEFNSGREVTPEDRESSARYTQSFADDKIDALAHLGKAFPNFSEIAFRDSVQRAVLQFLRHLKEIYKNSSDASIDDFDFDFSGFIETQGLTGYFNPESDMENYGMLENLSEAAQSLLFDTISDFNLTRTLYKRSDAEGILAIHLDKFEKLCKNIDLMA
jgi:hypothetical protein